MSFILEALKKLEQKRQQDAAPNLMTVHVGQQNKPRKRMLWPYFILAALVLNAGLFSAWFIQGETKNSDTAATVNMDSAIIKSDSITVKDPPKNEPVSVKSPTDTVDKTADDRPKQSTDSHVASKEKESQSEGSDSSTDPAASLNFLPSEEELDVLRAKIKEELSPANNSTTYKEKEDYEKDLIPATSDTDREIRDLSQLPEIIRKELPGISINGHIYSDNPSTRIVNINGIVVREGESISDNLRVEEITVSGVILTYRGHRFLVRAF